MQTRTWMMVGVLTAAAVAAAVWMGAGGEDAPQDTAVPTATAPLRLAIERLGMLILVGAAIVAAEPRLTLAFEDAGDPRPQRFALTGEIMGKALGLVISWSGGARHLLN